MRRFVALLLLTGCHTVFGTDGFVAPFDARGSRDIPHVPAGSEAPGEGAVVLANVTIDTTQNLVTPETAVTSMIVPQDLGGPSLVVVYADTLELADVVVTGSRPIVFLARTIRVTGVLDASANGAQPGPGASDDGRAEDGHTDQLNDSGGGGGSFAELASFGGGVTGEIHEPECPVATIRLFGGSPGVSRGSSALEILEGVGRGGNGSGIGCALDGVGGGGGGAVQLSATERIDIAGVIDASGGGGGGGLDCGSENADSGAGAGSGGAIYLDAPHIRIDGSLAANGGGGGGGGCATFGSGENGDDGSYAARADGGSPPDLGNCRAKHGHGGFGAIGAEFAGSGGDIYCGNAGGGGGGFGRIVLRAAAIEAPGIQSPMADLVVFED